MDGFKFPFGSFVVPFDMPTMKMLVISHLLGMDGSRGYQVTCFDFQTRGMVRHLMMEEELVVWEPSEAAPR